MVFTTKQNLKKYLPLSNSFNVAFEALEKLSREQFMSGKYEVENDTVFINAVEYSTHTVDTAKMEAHRKYIDVMFMISGEERILTAPICSLSFFPQEYCEANDVLFVNIPDSPTELLLDENSVVILFPEDAHAPGICSNEPSTVRKLIAKVAV